MRHRTPGKQSPRTRNARRVGNLVTSLSLVAASAIAVVVGVSSASAPLPRNLVANPGLESSLGGWAASTGVSKLDRVASGFQSKWAGRLQVTAAGAATSQVVYTGVVPRTTQGSVFALGIWVRLLPQQSVTFQAREVLGSTVVSSSRTVRAVKPGWYFVPMPYGAKRAGSRLDVTLTASRPTTKAPVLFDGLYVGQVKGAAVSTTTSTTTTSGTPVIQPASTSAASSVKGCAVKPSACGYPDATNTGVPAGTVLRSVPGQVSSGPGWHWDSRGWVSVDGNGAVLDGLNIPYNVDVTASNVTIKNSLMSVAGEGFGISLRHTSKVTIQDSEITGPSTGSTRLMVGIKDIYGDSTGTQILRNDIARTSTGVQMESGLIQDNYIHDMGYKSGDHLNGITSNGSTALLTIRHNTVLNSFDQTDAISLFEDFGVQANRTIDNNLVAGGGYTIYGGANPGGAATSNIHITNNRFSRLYYPNGGSYGPVTAYAPGGAGNTWTGNIWDDTLTPVNP